MTDEMRFFKTIEHVKEKIDQYDQKLRCLPATSEYSKQIKTKKEELSEIHDFMEQLIS